MSTLANSEDPDEMQHNAAFHQCLHCLSGLKRSTLKRIELHLNLESLTCNPLICSMNHPRLTCQTRWTNSLVYKGLMIGFCSFWFVVFATLLFSISLNMFYFKFMTYIHILGQKKKRRI